MIYAGGGRDFEFIYENDNNPRNEAADKLGGIPADSPQTYWVRLISDGSKLTRRLLVGRPDVQPRRPGRGHLRLGRPAGRADRAVGQRRDVPRRVVRLDPLQPGRHGWRRRRWRRRDIIDNFDGSDARRRLGRRPPGPGADRRRRHAEHPGAPATSTAAGNDARNLVLRDAPDGPWTATTKVNFQGTDAVPPGRNDGVRRRQQLHEVRSSSTTSRRRTLSEKFEFIYENAGTPRNEAADSTANIPTDFPDDFWLRITSDGTNITGAVLDRRFPWIPVGRPAPLPANAQIGLFSFATPEPVTRSPRSTSSSSTCPVAARPARASTTSSTARRSTRTAGTRSSGTPRPSTRSGGDLNITTSPGDIYSATPTRRRTTSSSRMRRTPARTGSSRPRSTCARTAATARVACSPT